ncbi:uncharacterized protein MONOS_6350 [Monocercomonoides exilis]|uniref:uncharacterized protein n=1 Tax=Monocercomonoides exilis TaxID=2049356 RepID=UPI00355A968D|nr:hypothetical protein MONOS_6350 [Monocercomonoides exilis]|eukprot:MONOS_6350.1-p1 / transcript=MONOS_6350.1 / gene=MONOS_6350 / organism=Monocercomonoides_exilis_PA203 / gene_product=unspecified product / transcript_product=unspecified product / location=Mono_scaffold00199:5295-8635(+) / protein_length=989 / sequence_SO=supercontig / SO=protein_coding / is_pseudo=false
MESGKDYLFGENNKAEYGKDVFVGCGSGVLLESKVNGSSFSFFDFREIPSDVVKLCGSEDGREGEVIPLFVYLCSIGSKLRVDGSGESVLDYSYCGIKEFGCLAVDYCANSKLSERSKEIEIVSSSSTNDEIELSLFDVNISGRIELSSEEERIQVNVSDEGSATQDWLVGCSSSVTMSRLSYIVKDQLNSRRNAFIHSTSTLSMTNCSVSFESGALTDGMMGYSIIDMAGGNLIIDGFVMESGVTLTMNGKSPITMTSGVQLELKNSRVSGVEVEVAGGNGGGGCLNVGMNEEGNVKIEESNFSSRCSGGSGMKGGGMTISIRSGGTLRVKGVNLSGCEAPSEDVENGGRGMGGGMFAEFVNQMGTFSLESMEFEGCEAWKGNNMFVSGWELSEIVNEDHFKWDMNSEELISSDELCGWERKMTGDEGYVIPLVVYLWNNWSGNGFVSGIEGGDFSGCGFSETPCSSIDHLVSLKYGSLVEGETHIRIVESGLLSYSISFLSLLQTSPDSDSPKVVIEGTKKGTDCSFGSLTGLTEAFGYCMMRVNGVSGFISFSRSVNQVIVQKVNISLTTVTDGSLISMIEEENQMNGGESTHLNGNRQVLRDVGCSFANITNEGIGASVIDVGSFENGVECVVDECSMSSCKSGLSDEGGGMRVVLKSGESVLKVNGSSFSMCKCSSGTGCGGGLFIDGSDPHANIGNESQIPPLILKIVNMLFEINEARVAKDIYVFVSGRGSDGRGRGLQSNPCSSINCGIEHIQEGVMNAILINGEEFETEELVIGDLNVNPFKKSQAIVNLKSEIAKSAEKDRIMWFINESAVERCSFEFEDTFEASRNCIMKEKNGSMEIQKCEFNSSATAEDMKLNSSVVSVECRELKISETTFKDIYSSRLVLSFHEESNVIIDETRISNIKCEGDVVSVGGKAKVEMKKMKVENVTLLLEGCVIGMEDAEQEERLCMLFDKNSFSFLDVIVVMNKNETVFKDEVNF